MSDAIDDTNTQALQDAQTAISEMRAARAELDRVLHNRKDGQEDFSCLVPAPPVLPVVVNHIDMQHDTPIVCDLAQLSGIGPGLVWMLSRCGISSIRRLAQSDANTLKQGLGIVSGIVDPDALISAAKAHHGTSRPKFSNRLNKAA